MGRTTGGKVQGRESLGHHCEKLEVIQGKGLEASSSKSRKISPVMQGGNREQGGKRCGNCRDRTGIRGGWGPFVHPSSRNEGCSGGAARGPRKKSERNDLQGGVLGRIVRREGEA